MTARATRPRNSPAARTTSTVQQPKPDRTALIEPPSMEEPTLHEMLHDPIMQRLMTSDGITRSQLLSLVAAARSRLREGRNYLR
ncbi:MAG TPA: hypothetical protein VKP60_06140 [Magnetospirillaceae bacterium]|nr:hypothetical protein [Magnetospirillaceae bacterium]